MSSVLKGAGSGLPGIGQNKKLSRKEAAAKSRRVGDNILAHWRVILAAKGYKGSRSFFHGLLPALPTRQEQQKEWKNTLPKLHAETMSLNEMWQKVVFTSHFRQGVFVSRRSGGVLWIARRR